MTYEQAVSEARTLVKRSDEDQWRLAQLTWEQVKAGKSRAQWARDIGVGVDHAEDLYAIWNRWKGVDPPHRPRFNSALEERDPSRSYQGKLQRGARRALADPEAVRQAIKDNPEVARAVAGDPQALSAMQRHQQPTEPGIPVDDAREMVRQAEAEAGPDVVHPITRINLIVGELKADFDAEEVAQRLLEYQRPDVIRSLGESVEFLTEVHQLSRKARRPQVIG